MEDVKLSMIRILFNSQLALLFSGLFVFFVFACSQPYNAMRANLIEAMILLDLLLLTSLSLDADRWSQSAVRPYSYILLLVPFVALVLYIGAKLFSYAWLAPFNVYL